MNKLFEMKNQYWITISLVFVFGCRSDTQSKQNTSLEDLYKITPPYTSSYKTRSKPYQTTKAEAQISEYIQQGYHLLPSSAHSSNYPFYKSDKSKILTVAFVFPPWRTRLSEGRTIEEVTYNNYFRETLRDDRYPDNFIVLRIHRKNEEDSKWLIPHNIKKHAHWKLPGGNSSVTMMYTHVSFSFNNKSNFTVEQMRELYGDFEVEIWNKDKGLLFKRRFILQHSGKDNDLFTTRTFGCGYRFGIKKQSCISDYEVRLQAQKNTEAMYKRTKRMNTKKKTGKWPPVFMLVLQWR